MSRLTDLLVLTFVLVGAAYVMYVVAALLWPVFGA